MGANPIKEIKTTQSSYALWWSCLLTHRIVGWVRDRIGNLMLVVILRAPTDRWFEAFPVFFNDSSLLSEIAPPPSFGCATGELEMMFNSDDVLLADGPTKGLVSRRRELDIGILKRYDSGFLIQMKRLAKSVLTSFNYKPHWSHHWKGRRCQSIPKLNFVASLEILCTIRFCCKPTLYFFIEIKVNFSLSSFLTRAIFWKFFSYLILASKCRWARKIDTQLRASTM